MDENMKLLPFTESKDMDKEGKWSLIYAFNIRLIRDVFAYCALKGGMLEKKLYDAMERHIIAPPRNEWINPTKKKRERLRLEYIHAARYLRLLKKDGPYIMPDLSILRDEKETIIEENRHRTFLPNEDSPPLTEKEKRAILSVVFNFERARDFLRWFLDFPSFPDIWSFGLEEFRRYAQPIYLIGQVKANMKGKELLRREVDRKVWRIPNDKPDLTRLVTFTFTSWFKELGLIDEIIVFPEFSFDERLWYMYYPIKIEALESSGMKTADILRAVFLKEEGQNVIWVPYLLYRLASRYYCSVQSMKQSIIKLFKEDFTHYSLDRSSLQVMRYSGKLRSSVYRAYKESFIEVDGFYRDYLRIIE